MNRCLLLIVVALSAPLTAQAGEPLTLEGAIARAAEVSTEVALQELSAETAEARWLADPRAGAPSVRVAVRDLEPATALYPNPGDPELVARFRLPFPRPWDLATAARQGEATVAREGAELDAIHDSLALAVTTRFHALPLLRASVASAEELTALRAEHLVLVEQRRAEGLATAIDWLDSEEDRRAADDRRAARVAELDTVEAELRQLLQWPADQPLEIVPDERDDEAPLPAMDAMLDGLSNRNPRVREAEADIIRAEARLRRLQLRALPWLDWAQGGAVFRQDQPVSFEVGVAIDIPVYLWSPTRTQAAAQELAGAKLRMEEVEAAAERRLARRVRAAEAARERWTVETAHRDAVTEHATPLLELADPVLKIELEARIVRAQLRVLAAYTELVRELDRLDGASHR
ncbi:MAG: TolC family protein [Proteobacteria bacterium]|nr:TolC family protein [Pseudomonadota bacterium]